MAKPEIKIKYPDGIHNNYGIQFFGLECIPYDHEGFTYSHVMYFFSSNCPPVLQYFFQGGFAIPESSMGWGFVECWNAKDNQDLFLGFVMELGKYFNIEIS
jgi:hypothetical protein